MNQNLMQTSLVAITAVVALVVLMNGTNGTTGALNAPYGPLTVRALPAYNPGHLAPPVSPPAERVLPEGADGWCELGTVNSMSDIGKSPKYSVRPYKVLVSPAECGRLGGKWTGK